MSININNLIDFDDLGDLLSSSGIIISNVNDSSTNSIGSAIDLTGGSGYDPPAQTSSSSASSSSASSSSASSSSASSSSASSNTSSSASNTSSSRQNQKSHMSSSSSNPSQFKSSSSWQNRKSNLSASSSNHSQFKPKSSWQNRSSPPSPKSPKSPPSPKSPVSPVSYLPNTCRLCSNLLTMKVKLHCGHEFCLGCIKGQLLILKRSQQASCPYCHSPMPNHMKKTIQKNPQNLVEFERSSLDQLDVYWFYSSRDRQWWSFDIPSTLEIEKHYRDYARNHDLGADKIFWKSPRLQICGMTRIFDFASMLQVNDYNQSSRCIKRIEKADIERFMSSGMVKGIAGLRDKGF
jgi:hypothetical protein